MTRALNRIIHSLLVILCFCWAGWLATQPLPARGGSSVEVIRPGVIHRTIVDRDGPWSIHVVEINVGHPELRIESACAEDRLFGRETVSSIAIRKSNADQYVAVAINGDYFNPGTGEAQNNHIVGGSFVKAFRSRGHRPEFVDIPNSQFAVTHDGRPLIEQFMFDGSVLGRAGLSIALAGVNIIPRRGGVVLYNRYFGKQTPVPDGLTKTSELTVRIARTAGDTMICTSIENSISPEGGIIPEGGLVLTEYGGEILSTQSNEDSLRIVLAMLPDSGPLKELVGGWPRIVRNGKNVFKQSDFPEDPRATIFSKRHPRSGVGFSSDSTTLYFITVDGRQQRTVGMSLSEFADLMIRLGIYQGLNLDGGGSTTLVINGRVVNSPSDPTGERAIGNCLLLVADTDRGKNTERASVGAN
ncbi:MAG: phosphodiester glycosidase family protein [Bacteroidota bacterium]